jgi:sirohydrochlorin ferrochelatase
MGTAADIALVLAAHGDRGGADRNAVLRQHAARLRDNGVFKSVSYGVLNGEPGIVDVLTEADGTKAARILVYPFFMSGGYFAGKVLPERLAQARLTAPVRVLPPLGLDPALPELLVARSLDAAKNAGFEPAETRLLVAGHGSKIGRAPAAATEKVANAVRSRGQFRTVATAFLEEPPFLADALRAGNRPTVVAGFFVAEGMHGHDDVPGAIREAAIPCVYTRPIGSDPGIPALVQAAATKGLSDS